VREDAKMIRIIFGSLLLLFFGLGSIAGLVDINNWKSSEEELAFITCLIFAGLGSLLIYLGHRHRKRWKAIKELAIQMIKTNEKINSEEIAQNLKLSNILVVEYLAKLRKKGFLQNNAKYFDKNSKENPQIIQQNSERDSSNNRIVNSEETKIRLKELKSLFEEGIISKEEFHQKKEAIGNINRS
jgi:predicted transcriptional regulator